MNKLGIALFVGLCGLALAGPARADHTVAATAIQTTDPCTVLMGGGGMVFPNEAQNQGWFKVNSAVSYATVAALQGMGYDIEPLVVDVRDAKARRKMLGAIYSRDHCARVVQITNALSGQSKSMPGVAANFEFDVSVLAIEPGGTLTNLYEKTYRYPLTSKVMQALSMSAVGRTIASDVDHAHVLPKVSIAPAGGGQVP